MIGILPCAGKSERIHGLPKYLLPCPPDSYLFKYHCDGLYKAAVNHLWVGANPDNYEILSRLEYHYPSKVLVKKYATMTETVLSIRDNAIEHGSNEFESHSILFGMPDTYFYSPETVYEGLSDLLTHGADVAVAVWKARPGQHKHGGMVRLNGWKSVLEVVDKPETTDLEYIWGALAWKPMFWDCLSPDMPHVGYGLSVAIERGLKVRAVVIPGNFYDCGTPERYFEMIRETTCAPQSV